MTKKENEETINEMLHEIGMSATYALNEVLTLEEMLQEMGDKAPVIEEEYWKELMRLKRACKPLHIEIVGVPK